MQLTSVLSESAKAEIETLVEEGITLTPEEIVRLNFVGHRLDTPESRLLLSRGRPVVLAGVTLWPLTLRAVEWLERVCSGMNPFERRCAVGYASRYGRSLGRELNIGGRTAEKAVKDWFFSLRCTRREYDEALAQLDAQDYSLELPPDPTTGARMTIGDFALFLHNACGGSADFWERRCAVGYAVAALSLFVVQNHADKHPCSEDPRIKAERAMGWLSERIRKRHKERHGP
jgi:hypothetical protein